MTAFSNELEKNVERILGETWNSRDSRKVPNTSNVALRGGGRRIDGTFLYADLRHSTFLATNYQNRTAAKVIKSFIFCACRIIKANNGTITSFDGDRVMGVFVGNEKNSQAAKAGLQINWAVQNVVQPRATKRFQAIDDSGFDITHGVGIDTGSVLAVRAGQPGANDLVWVGRAPNVAAKLSDISEAGYRTYIHRDVYSQLNDHSKYDDNEVDMWEQSYSTIAGASTPLHRSKYSWKP